MGRVPAGRVVKRGAFEKAAELRRWRRAPGRRSFGSRGQANLAAWRLAFLFLIGLIVGAFLRDILAMVRP